MQSVYLGRDRLLVRANWGGHMVVPTYNLDVAIGVVRDGVIEPWTTRLIQELTRPGDVVINGGANFGYYAALVGGIVGPEGLVIAVEANLHILPYLMLTRHWSGLTDRIVIVHRALWSEGGKTLNFSFDPNFLGNGQISSFRKERLAICLGADPEAAIWSSANVAQLVDGDGVVDLSKQLTASVETRTATIDALAPGDRQVDVIHLDIEGAEPFAILGARETIRRSPNLRLVSEWSTQNVDNGEWRAAASAAFDFLAGEGYRVRRLHPRQAPDGAIFVSDPLDRDYFLNQAEHGDYAWLRQSQDPWG